MVDGEAGTTNQNPQREERDADAPAKTKCGPGGRDLMPVKRGVEVKVRRSMPTREFWGREGRRMVGVCSVGGGGEVMTIIARRGRGGEEC